MANIGRDLLIKIGAAVIAGVRTKSVAFNGEPVDATSDDTNGFRTYLSDPGTKSFDFGVEGIVEDDVVQDIVFGGGSLLLTNVTLEFPLRTGDATKATITGNVFLANFSEDASHTDAITYSMSLQSSGPWVYAAAT